MADKDEVYTSPATSEQRPEQEGAAVERKIAALARKRDHAADTLNKPLLAWSYQLEIDDLLAGLGNSPDDAPLE